MLDIKFKIEGVTELHRRLLVEVKNISDLSTPLRKSGKLVLADVQENFRSEGGLVGGWEPLAESTVRQRGGAAHPILVRTGSYKNSFTQHVTKKKTRVYSFAPYHVYHQSKAPRKGSLPRRRTLAIIELTRQNIVEEFNNYLRFS